MKKAILLIVLAITVAACSNNKNESTSNAKAEVNLIDKYLTLKDALVATDAAKAKVAASDFIKVNTNIKLDAALKTIAGTNDVAAQRVAFEELSINMYSLVKTAGTDVTLYKQFCPMAFSGKGAYWLATEEEVNNPYYGDKMLHCGSVQETIAQ